MSERIDDLPAALARAGLLVVVDEPINKDTEMHPLVRWQYRAGIAESDLGRDGER